MNESKYIIAPSILSANFATLGEEVVNESFQAAVRASNWYDEEKDGIINNFTYEVKTQTINNRDNGFWQEQNSCQNTGSQSS